MAEDAKKLLDNLPLADAPGRASDHADPMVCGARVSRVNVNLERLLDELPHEDLLKQKGKCRGLPDKYYEDK